MKLVNDGEGQTVVFDSSEELVSMIADMGRNIIREKAALQQLLGVLFPEPDKLPPECAKCPIFKKIRKDASPEKVSTPFLGLAHREHDRYLETKRERNDALIERRLANEELDALRRRLRTCEAAQAFPPIVGARVNVEKKIAHLLGEYLLATGAIRFTEDTDTYEDRSLTVLLGKVVILQPKAENESGRLNEVT